MTSSSADTAATAKLLSRTELLGGGLGGRTAKQASALLLLIETHTAQVLADSRQAAAPFAPATTRRAQSQAYLQTLAQERSANAPPTIRDLERYARQWAQLVPESATTRAATAHLLGAKYRMPRRMTPGIRAALGLDDNGVQQAYQQLYSQPLATIYTDALSITDRLRWRWARLAGRLENLSPFWSAFALTLTETVGAGILALPIALATVGPLASVILLVVLGLVNVLTLAGLTEAITRYGPIRYGSAFFGQLVSDMLGRTGTIMFSFTLLALNLLILGAYYVGIATALAEATGITASIWAAALFGIGVYFLMRRSLNATIASALMIGIINLSLIFAMIALAIPHIQWAYLRYVYVPGINGAPFDPTIIELVFGIVLTAFFGHTALGNVAKVVLHRDPGGRTFHRGNVAALLVALLIYVLWIIAINGALAPIELAQTTGTVLGPLARRAGPAVHLFGGIFVVLGMGMVTVYFSLGLFNQVQEWLPAPTSTADTSGSRFVRFWRNRAGIRFLLGLLPVLLIFLIVEWMLYRNQVSFARPLSLIGALGAPLLAGIFPILLLVVSRRKGDYVPSARWQWLGHPVVLTLIYLIFFGGVLAHGLVIWPDPLRRGVALLTCAGMLLLTGLVLRRRALTPRTVVEVRQESGHTGFQVVSHGEALPVVVEIHEITREERVESAAGTLPNLANVRSLLFHLPPDLEGELKLWLHQVTPEGVSVGLPAHCRVHSANSVQEHVITSAQPTLILPMNEVARRLEVQFMTTTLSEN
ncbi:MAG TPA: aromatic amino acid transport family protein [Caldilineaceae bacterium]|nr:aromatic amino acid transport family protein [Caldilineaceae bacterium]